MRSSDPLAVGAGRRAYDVMTDEMVAPLHAVADRVDRDLRYRALLAAVEAAKLGLAHDIYATAARYAAWLAGGEVEDNPRLPFHQRLQDLVDECVKSGEVDHDLVIHHMQVVMGIAVWPYGSGPVPINGEQP
jgi:hypothetical protein